MGLFSSGGKGNSRAQTSSTTSNTQTTTNQVDNRVFELADGSVVVEGDNATVTTTDQGAIAAAGELGRAAFEFGSDGFTAVDRASGRVLEAADLAIASSRGLAEDSIEAQSTLAYDALTFGGSVLEGAQEFARGIFSDAFEQSADVLKEGQTQLGNTVTNLNAIARQQSTSEAERVQDLATKVLYAGAAMVGLVMLAGAFKSRAA